MCAAGLWFAPAPKSQVGSSQFEVLVIILLFWHQDAWLKLEGGSSALA